jgi:hypothetical protein
MTAIQKYITTQTDRCRKEWFKEHKANIVGMNTLLATDPMLIINWQKPGTWTYGCRFIIHRRWLMVVGDIGEATFGWGQDITPDFLLSINFDYFLGKCQASPSGTKFEQWDRRVAFENFEQFINQDGMESLKNELGAEITLGTGEDEYKEIAREYYDKTGNAEVASELADFGKVPSVHAIGMFVGLQMALAQLKEKQV